MGRGFIPQIYRSIAKRYNKTNGYPVDSLVYLSVIMSRQDFGSYVRFCGAGMWWSGCASSAFSGFKKAQWTRFSRGPAPKMEVFCVVGSTSLQGEPCCAAEEAFPRCRLRVRGISASFLRGTQIVIHEQARNDGTGEAAGPNSRRPAGPSRHGRLGQIGQSTRVGLTQGGIPSIGCGAFALFLNSTVTKESVSVPMFCRS